MYDLKAVELLRDVFVWAYERSCQRYMAIRETTVDPPILSACAIARRSLPLWVGGSCAVG